MMPALRSVDGVVRVRARALGFCVEGKILGCGVNKRTPLFGEQQFCSNNG
jgi:hypothetical protein